MINTKRLKNIRESQNLTQRELAEKIGVTQTQYSRIENGSSGTSIETLEAILQVLGIQITDLWNNENLRTGLAQPSSDGCIDGVQAYKIIEFSDGTKRLKLSLPTGTSGDEVEDILLRTIKVLFRTSPEESTNSSSSD
jgi:transcriptional regulator with XRE-family HTH domain